MMSTARAAPCASWFRELQLRLDATSPLSISLFSRHASSLFSSFLLVSQFPQLQPRLGQFLSSPTQAPKSRNIPPDNRHVFPPLPLYRIGELPLAKTPTSFPFLASHTFLPPVVGLIVNISTT